MESGQGRVGRNSVVGIGLVGGIVAGVVEDNAGRNRSSYLELEGRERVLGAEGIVAVVGDIVDVGEEERNSVVAEEEDLRGSRRRSNLGLT